MKNYRIYLITFILTIIIGLNTEIMARQSTGSEAVENLAKRIIPKHAKDFIFKIIPEESDYFEISKPGKKVIIKGNNPVSIATGLNWYLKYYCNCDISYCGDNLSMPKVLPSVNDVLRIETSLTKNTYMNYCTFSYTTSFWDWERWEREIDLMALSGINLPLAMVGSEVVWRNTLRQIGYTDSEIKDFLCGPCYFGWLLMGNMEKLGGPLPDEWFERQTALQKKIVARMREYGMKPIFQGFYGMVPQSMQKKYPQAKIVEQGNWCGLHRPPVLLSTDSLFDKIANIWYTEYEKLFGRADYFGGDLFHEGGIIKNLNITEIAHEVQRTMLKYNPQATWVLQAWQDNPKTKVLEGLSKDHTLIIDLAGEMQKFWKNRNGFMGFNWLVSNVSNYGGNIGLNGRLDNIAGAINEIISSHAESNLKGIGSTPEGIEINPVVFELANEMRWKHDCNMDIWIEKYADRRYGLVDENIRKAWNILYKTAYGSYPKQARPTEPVLCAKPSLAGKRIVASTWGVCNISYDNDEYGKAVALLLTKAEKLKDVPSFQHDIVDFVRQYISNIGSNTYYEIVECYKRGDVAHFNTLTEKFLEIILDVDKLCSTHPMFCVGTFIDRAKSAANGNKEAELLYERNARQLITTWTENQDPVRDYANREWSGLLKDFYYPRWQAYFKYLQQKLAGDKNAVEPDSFPMERKWVEDTKNYSFNTESKPVETSIELFKKYSK